MIIKTALISVSDKTNIVQLAKILNLNNVKIISTGGTFDILKKNNIKAIKLSDYTNFPEIMNGRVKTLHPKIHGGILYRKNIDEKVMKSLNISCIDLVIVNLYPFEKMMKKNLELNELIEFIDIGGPSLLRASAKNYKNIITVCNYEDYNIIIDSLHNKIAIDEKTRFNLACKVFNTTAKYDGIISNVLNKINIENKDNNVYPDILNLQLIKKQDLRYGENPHQKAAIYCYSNLTDNKYFTNVTNAVVGKELSYNNIVDAETAISCVLSFKKPSCVIVKHANPCGVATSEDITNAYKKAFSADKISAFGGIIAFNRVLNYDTVDYIINNQFLEVLISPDITESALKLLKNKKSNIRYIKCKNTFVDNNQQEVKSIIGEEFLIQDKDSIENNNNEIKVATNLFPTIKEMEDLKFAWIVSKFVKSNAIVLVKDHVTIGIGCGQTSRIDSCNIALNKAKANRFSLSHSVLASDAFFPFIDVIESVAKEGITSIIQPGGSINDHKVIKAADDYKISMVITGIRHFKH